MTFGDSKTARNEWQPLLVANLRNAGNHSAEIFNAGFSGSGVAMSVPETPGTGVDHLLLTSGLGAADLVGTVLMNWGVNDMQSWPLDQETWEGQYGQIVEWAHETFINAKIYLSYPWRGGFDEIAATMHGWIDNIIAAHAPYTFAGVDEAIVIKADDDGVLETDAGRVHYSVPLGVTLYAEAMHELLIGQ